MLRFTTLDLWIIMTVGDQYLKKSLRIGWLNIYYFLLILPMYGQDHKEALISFLYSLKSYIRLRFVCLWELFIFFYAK